MTELSKGAAVGLVAQRSQLSVTGGSILAPVSNSKGGENLFSKPSRRYVGLSRGRQPETLVPWWSLMGHCESPGSHNGLYDSTLHYMVHGIRLGRRRLDVKWRRSRILSKLLAGTPSFFGSKKVSDL